MKSRDLPTCHSMSPTEPKYWAFKVAVQPPGKVPEIVRPLTVPVMPSEVVEKLAARDALGMMTPRSVTAPEALCRSVQSGVQIVRFEGKISPPASAAVTLTPVSRFHGMNFGRIDPSRPSA